MNTSLRIGKSLNGILDLLLMLDTIAINEDNHLYIVKTFNIESIDIFKEYFYKNFFNKLDSNGLLSSFYTYDNLIYDKEFQTYAIKENYIPFKLYNIKNFLLESDFFQRHELISSLLMVNKDYLEIFEIYIVDVLNSSNKLTRTIDQLKNDLEAKEIYGEEAEQFVLEYELKRLNSHPKKENIKQISKTDVSAGYDIQSFHSNSSVLIDRFIEVKSFTKVVRFHWSKNEIQTACVLGRNYFLYLVDRSKINENNYSPIMIQDPYVNIFKEEAWCKEAVSWVLSQVN